MCAIVLDTDIRQMKLKECETTRVDATDGGVYGASNIWTTAAPITQYMLWPLSTYWICIKYKTRYQPPRKADSVCVVLKFVGKNNNEKI